MSQQENVDVVGAFIEAYNSGDVDRIETLCTDECEIAGTRATLEETSYVGPHGKVTKLVGYHDAARALADLGVAAERNAK